MSCSQNIVVAGAGADKQNRNIRLFPQLLAESEAGPVSQIDIQQEKGDRILF